MAEEQGGKRPIIIKKIYQQHDGQMAGVRQPAGVHYLSGMMAFFILVWLLAAASPQARQGVVDYFHHRPGISISGGSDTGAGIKQKETEQLQQLKGVLEQLIAREPQLQQFKDQVEVEVAEGGLRIQVAD